MQIKCLEKSSRVGQPRWGGDHTAQDALRSRGYHHTIGGAECCPLKISPISRRESQVKMFSIQANRCHARSEPNWYMVVGGMLLSSAAWYFSLYTNNLQVINVDERTYRGAAWRGIAWWSNHQPWKKTGGKTQEIVVFPRGQKMGINPKVSRKRKGKCSCCCRWSSLPDRSFSNFGAYKFVHFLLQKRRSTDLRLWSCEIFGWVYSAWIL